MKYLVAVHAAWRRYHCCRLPAADGRPQLVQAHDVAAFIKSKAVAVNVAVDVNVDGNGNGAD
jgi:hypothetical protein